MAENKKKDQGIQMNAKMAAADDADKKSARRGKKSKDSGADNGKPKQKNIKARLLVSGIAVLLVVAIVVVILNIRPIGAGNKLPDEITTASYLRDKSMNVLICGIDDEEGRDRAMTDVIMVANFDRENNKASIVQIPRDTYVGENLVNTGKINALYNWGYKDGDDVGVVCLAETIYNQLKLPIDNYVLITMEGFRAAVDAMGGVDVELDVELDFSPYGGSKLEPGVHHLDGAAADYFVRFREGYATQDIERLNTQRYLMAALMKRLLSMSTMEMASIISAVYEYLETDLTIQQMIQLASEAKKLSMDTVTFVRLPGEPVAKYGYYGLDVFTLHKKETADVLNKYMRPHGDPVPETELELIELQKTIDWYSDEGTSLDEYAVGGA